MPQLFDRIVLLECAGLQWRDLRVTFAVSRTSTSKPNKAEIKVWNLSETSRVAVAAKGAALRLSAGYANATGGNVGVVFAGQVDFAQSARDGPDIVTTIYAADGRTAWARAASKSWSAGTPHADLVAYLANEMGLALAPTSLANVKGSARGPFALYGYAHRDLDTLLAGLGLQWSIQEGVLQIVAPDAAVQGVAIVLSPESGLIGSPEVAEPKKAKGKTRPALKCKALLQPELAPGRRVRLQARDHAGDYRIDRADHAGDSYEGDFVTALHLSAVAQ